MDEGGADEAQQGLGLEILDATDPVGAPRIQGRRSRWSRRVRGANRDDGRPQVQTENVDVGLMVVRIHEDHPAAGGTFGEESVDPARLRPMQPTGGEALEPPARPVKEERRRQVFEGVLRRGRPGDQPGLRRQVETALEQAPEKQATQHDIRRWQGLPLAGSILVKIERDAGVGPKPSESAIGVIHQP